MSHTQRNLLILITTLGLVFAMACKDERSRRKKDGDDKESSSTQFDLPPRHNIGPIQDPGLAKTIEEEMKEKNAIARQLVAAGQYDSVSEANKALNHMTTEEAKMMLQRAEAAAAAAGRGEAPEAPAASNCGDVYDNILSILGYDGAPSKSEFIESCKKESTPEQRACLITATSKESIQRCWAIAP